MNPYYQFVSELPNLFNFPADSLPLGGIPPHANPGPPRRRARRAFIFSPHPDDRVHHRGLFALRLMRETGCPSSTSAGSRKAKATRLVNQERFQEPLPTPAAGWDSASSRRRPAGLERDYAQGTAGRAGALRRPFQSS